MPLDANIEVSLRDVTHADLPDMFELQLDPESNRMAFIRPRPRDVFFERWELILREKTAIGKIIQVNGAFAGTIGFFQQNGLDSIGYLVAREFWGRGVATRAVQLMIREITVRPLHARVARPNTGSVRVLQKCGFVITGYAHSPGDERYIECEEVKLRLD